MINIFQAIINIVALALPIIRQVEELIEGAKQGQVKKALATEVVAGAVSIAQEAGAISADDAQAARAVSGSVIELGATVLNRFGLLKPHAG